MPQKWEVTLPWPDKKLSPNARVHFFTRSKTAKRYRYACKLRTLAAAQAERWNLAALRDLVSEGGKIHLFIDFYPPDRRDRDDDNVIAAFKAGRDGVADALKIDDCHFRTHPFLKTDEVVKGGAVRVVVTAQGPEA